jgi:hypothetical protein
MTYDIILLTGMTSRFWHAKPIGAYRLATELRQKGYSVKVVDFISQWLQSPNDFYKLITNLVGNNTLFIGFSSVFFGTISQTSAPTSYSEYLGYGLSSWPTEFKKFNLYIKWIRKFFPHVKLVYGGKTQTVDINEVAASKLMDYIVVGLADNTIVELANHLKNKVPIKYMINSGTKIINYDPLAHGFDFVNSRTKFLPQDHIQPGEVVPFETSRGCMFKCSFCGFPLLGRKKNDPAYHKQVEVIAQEWAENFAQWNVSSYMMVDDTFNESTIKLEDLLRARDLSKVDISFSAYIRADLLDRFPEQIGLLDQLGLKSAFFGIESLYQPSARAIGKSSHPEKIKNIVSTMKQQWSNSDLRMLGSFIIGLPEDSPETLSTWIPWLFTDESPFDNVQMPVLSLMDYSEISNSPEKFGYTVDPTNNTWKNKFWDQGQAHQYASSVMKELWNANKLNVAGWDYMGFQNLKISTDYLKNTSLAKLDYSMLLDAYNNNWNTYKQELFAFEKIAI